MTFSNPIVAGEDLIRSGIRSPNYVQGVSGWRVAKDGTAEFVGVTIKGSLVVGNANGNRIYLKPGPNSFGLGQATLQFFTGSPFEQSPGEIFGNRDADTSAGNMSLQIWSPLSTLAGKRRASLQLFGGDSDTGALASLGISGNGPSIQANESDVRTGAGVTFHTDHLDLPFTFGTLRDIVDPQPNWSFANDGSYFKWGPFYFATGAFHNDGPAIATGSDGDIAPNVPVFALKAGMLPPLQTISLQSAGSGPQNCYQFGTGGSCQLVSSVPNINITGNISVSGLWIVSQG